MTLLFLAWARPTWRQGDKPQGHLQFRNGPRWMKYHNIKQMCDTFDGIFRLYQHEKNSKEHLSCFFWPGGLFTHFPRQHALQCLYTSLHLLV